MRGRKEGGRRAKVARQRQREGERHKGRYETRNEEREYVNKI